MTAQAKTDRVPPASNARDGLRNELAKALESANP